MAVIKPYFQQWVDMRNGTQVGVHRLKLLSASDTFTVPNLANTNASASSDQIRDANDASVTVTDNGNNTITLTGGVAGNTCIICSVHRFINSGDES